jgi:hypothetical protein
MELISGAEILERPGWGLEFELINAYDWGLSPYREVDGARMTTASKCFNCKLANKDYMPGIHDKYGGACQMLQEPPLKVNLGLHKPPFIPSFSQAKKIDLELTEQFFVDGEFVFDAGVIDITNASQFRFLVFMLGADKVDHLMLEQACDNFHPMSNIYMGDRLKAVRFKLKDVERFELLHGIGQAGTGQVEGEGQEPAKTPLHFTCAEDLVDYYREQGVHEHHELARQVDKEFTGKARLTDEALGRLLPANPGAEVSDEAHKRRGHRLRKAYQQSAE